MRSGVTRQPTSTPWDTTSSTTSAKSANPPFCALTAPVGRPCTTTFDFLAQLWLTGLSGSSASDIYAVGEGFDESGGSSFGAILHFDGQSWSMVSGPPLPPQLEGALYTVSSSSATEVYAVGFTFNIVNGDENATAIHFDGRSWSPTSVPGSDHLVLRDVWSKTGSGAFAVGDDNTVAYRGDRSGPPVRRHARGSPSRALGTIRSRQFGGLLRRTSSPWGITAPSCTSMGLRSVP